MRSTEENGGGGRAKGAEEGAGGEGQTISKRWCDRFKKIVIIVNQEATLKRIARVWFALSFSFILNSISFCVSFVFFFSFFSPKLVGGGGFVGWLVYFCLFCGFSFARFADLSLFLIAPSQMNERTNNGNDNKHKFAKSRLKM